MKIALSLFSALLASLAQAQTPPRIGFVYPAGGKQGTTLTVSVGGQNLNGASAVFFSTAGISARVTGYERPLTQKELNDLREKLEQLQDKRVAARDRSKPPFTAEDERTVMDLRETLATRGNRQATPAVAETVTLEMALSSEVAIGEHELRLKTASGLSNPLVFWVGELAEHTTPVTAATRNRTLPRGRTTDGRPRARETIEIALPTVVNGQILAGEVDRFQFAARKGQRLTFTCAARALIPYLADAVPGWFQATLAVYDEQGRELVYADDYRFNPDPVVACEIPAHGTYVLEIKDAIYRGREDFVYRITAGELPFVTSIFPLGGRTDDRVAFDVHGWNLPLTRVDVGTQNKPPGTYLLSMREHGIQSNTVRFALERGRGQLELEPNHAVAQQVALPATLDGRIDAPGDVDAFSFVGRCGEIVVAEVLARRMGSPLDSVLVLTDAEGRRLTTNDDHEDKGTGLLTHHADSRISLTLPADGMYVLRISDAQRHGGSDFNYRLRMGSPQPDFELRVVPSTINVRAGASVPFTVYALRRDGFDGEIALGLLDAPRGFALSGARIPPNESSVRLTLSVPADARDDAPALRLAGRASIHGKPIVHAAAPADDMMQAFAYRHLVPAKELRVCVAGKAGMLRVLDPRPVRFSGNRISRVRVAVPFAKTMSRVTFELVEPPPGVTVRDVSLKNSIAEVTLACDPATSKRGAQGNLILQIFGDRANRAPPKSKFPLRTTRVPLGVVPAIPYLIAEPLNPDS